MFLLVIIILNKFYINILGFPDPLDLATGMEKKEMLLRLAGNDVSFFIVIFFIFLFFLIILI